MVVIITLLVHSFVGTIIYIVTNENDTLAAYYTTCIIGCIFSAICYLVKAIKRWWRYHDKRSIFEDENDNKFYCKVKYADDFKKDEQKSH